MLHALIFGHGTSSSSESQSRVHLTFDELKQRLLHHWHSMEHSIIHNAITF